MRRIAVLVLCLAGLSALVLEGRGAPARAAGPTSECGVVAETNWTTAGSPYVVCSGGATIAPTATLTVQPGVVVEFQSGVNSKLNVQGTFDAGGTATQPITFTGVVTSAGSWGGISVDSATVTPAHASLENVTLEYGGISGSSGAQVFIDRGFVTITHALVRFSAGSGVYATTRAHVELHSTHFAGNGLDAVRLFDPVYDLPFSDLTASGNLSDVVHIMGLNTLVSGAHRWAFPGLPYVVDDLIFNQNGDVLTIDPGSELRFGSNSGLQIGGQLNALGLPAQPITFTAQTPAPGMWRGILLQGGAQRAVAQLENAMVEFGGGDVAGANIEVSSGRLIARNSAIRAGRLDGVLIDSSGSVSVLNSQVVSNGVYGIRNLQPGNAVLASDDWWGDANGPQSDLAACSAGNGDRVSAGVLFRPVLTDANTSAPFPLSAAPSLTLTPRRWFAPADGVTRVYFDITLRDGNGAPLAGRTVRLSTSLGTPTDGGITDATGHTLATLVSSTAGDAEVTAALDATACEGAVSPTSKVTFTPPVNITDLFPDSPAPYLSDDIGVTPLPVLTGVTTTLSAKLTNPLSVPITVDVSFGFVQAGIGLTFGPIKDISGQVIPANGSVTLRAAFVPVVAGHYCVQVSYAITAVGPGSALPAQVASSGGSRQRNLNVYQGPTGSNGKEAGLQKTRKSLSATNKFVSATYDTGPIALPLAVANQGIAWDLNNAEKISNALQGDPPRQDYTQLSTPHKLMLPPLQPGGGVSAARAAALNALDDALAEANADGVAAAIALDRSGGASEAGELQWASLQSAALLEYNQLMGQSFISAALQIDNVISVAASEGVTSVVISAADVITMQQHLASGFTAQEIDDAHTLGLSDADIEAIRQSILAASPNDLAGDLIPKMQALRDQFLLLGAVLTHPAVFAPGLSVGGSAGAALSASGGPAASGSGNTLVQVYNTTATIQVANPLTTTTAIDLLARRIDLPADWAVNVSPAQVTLAPGALTTATVEIVAGAPLPQGSSPRVAVEGYAGGQLLGGVVVDVLAPRYVLFDGRLRKYLPLLGK